MKIFQIFEGKCHWDATTKHPTIASTVGVYHSSIVFVEAPDTVQEGWIYDETAEGDARFVDPSTVTPASPAPTTEERVAALETQLAAAQAANTMLEECIVEMAGIVYA